VVGPVPDAAAARFTGLINRFVPSVGALVRLVVMGGRHVSMVSATVVSSEMPA
jgi:hypothetical protein